MSPLGTEILAILCRIKELIFSLLRKAPVFSQRNKNINLFCLSPHCSLLQLKNELGWNIYKTNTGSGLGTCMYFQAGWTLNVEWTFLYVCAYLCWRAPIKHGVHDGFIHGFGFKVMVRIVFFYTYSICK